MAKRIYLEDLGQDVLWLDVDAAGQVVDSNLQRWYWVGKRVKLPVRRGVKPYVQFNSDEEFAALRYRCTRLSKVPAIDGAIKAQQPANGGT